MGWMPPLPMRHAPKAGQPELPRIEWPRPGLAGYSADLVRFSPDLLSQIGLNGV
jgi:hypothetical protein